MGRWDNDYYYPPYISVAEKKANANKKLSQLKKKNPGIRPVVINGRTIASTWWGKSWNKNLERYADYSNRIERGRSYVRHSCVLDLQIKPGEIHSLVQGTHSKPYEIVIRINGIDKLQWLNIKKTCSGRLDSLQALLAGKFPAELAEVFMVKEQGLFPSPREIEFSCSCPDWASMCKHVAATLYGVGARLDEDPSLFFLLRKVKVDELISQAAKSKSKALLDKAKTKSSRVLADDGLSDLFGIVMEQENSFEKGRKKQKAATSTEKKDAPPTTIPGQKKKVAAPNAKPILQPKPDTREIDQIEKLVAKSKNGITTSELVAETNLSATRIYSLVYQLKGQGKLVVQSRGVYCKAE